ncbi:hypothetical protein N7527_008763 [Penicillium freii]|nr:hypothetical protein N7527_008763 [Penicillium freii]
MGVSGSTLSGRPLRMQAQRVDPSDTTTMQGPLKDVFGEYTIVRGKFNGRPSTKRNWYCKHQYAREGGNDSYHYVHLDGRYHSTNPDGSREHINPILKQAFYTPPTSNRWIDCSDEVDWEGLNEIPDLCIARASVTHEAVGKFMQEMKSQEEKTIKNDQTEKRKICARMLKGKETEDMGTDDEAEETDYETEETECETEEVSDEETATKKKKKERKDNQQRTDSQEDHTPQETAAQRKTPMLEEQASNNGSIDESPHLGEAEGTSSRKRKANEMDDGEEQTAGTPVAKKANMNRRRELTAAERKEQRRNANRRSRDRKRRKALARQEMEERTSGS